MKEIVKIVIECVEHFCGRTKNNFTLLQVTDILKGNLNKKFNEQVYSCKLFLGRLKLWQKPDLFRFLRKLVIEDFLTEYLIVINANASQMYVEAGPNIAQLLKDGKKLYFTLNKEND